MHRAGPQRRSLLRSGAQRRWSNISTQSLDEPAETPAHGAFELAGERLEKLLTTVRNNRDSLMDEVETYTPEQRLTLLANCGATITLVGFVACFVGREDPLGGMTLTPSTLEAAAHGLLFGLPLLVCSAMGHSRPAKAAFPVLDELHAEQRKLVAPLITGMSVAQLGALFGFVILPVLIFLLPAYKAGWDAFEGFVSAALLSPSHLFAAAPKGSAAAVAMQSAPHLPRELRSLVPSVLSACTAGFVVGSCLSVRDWEVAAIKDALSNANRYFRMRISERRGATASSTSNEDSDLASAAPDADGNSSGGPASASVEAAVAAAAASSEAGGRSAARAFRLVASVWLLQRFQVSRLGFILASLNICYYFVMWQVTWDLATPAAAALLHCSAECWFSAAEQREEDGLRRRRLEAAHGRAGVRTKASGGDGAGSGLP